MYMTYIRYLKDTLSLYEEQIEHNANLTYQIYLAI